MGAQPWGNARTENIVDEKDRGVDWDKADALFVRSFSHGGALVVQAIGSVTTTTLGTLAAALPPLVENSPAEITVDLRRVDFLDSGGLSLLVKVSRHLRALVDRPAPRVLVMPGRQPERVLRQSGFDKIVEIAYDLGDAL